MTRLFTVNQLPNHGADSVFRWKTAKKAAGWTVPSSSDGTTYNASGDQITTFSTGAGGLANTNAWFRIRDPAGLREYIYQRTTGNGVWRVKYSASARFSGGSPSATRVPSATDEAVTMGSGTDASPIGQSLFPADGSYYVQIMCDNAAPYACYLLAYLIGGGTTSLVTFIHDPLAAYDPLDQDPLIVYHNGTHNSTILGTATMGSSVIGPMGWMKYNLSGASFVRIPAGWYASGSGVVCPSNMPSNPHSSNDDELPVFYARATALGIPVGWKGVSSLLRWRGLDRSTGSTIDLAPDTKNRLVIGNVSVPWDGTTTPAV